MDKFRQVTLWVDKVDEESEWERKEKAVKDSQDIKIKITLINRVDSYEIIMICIHNLKISKGANSIGTSAF